MLWMRVGLSFILHLLQFTLLCHNHHRHHHINHHHHHHQIIVIIIRSRCLPWVQDQGQPRDLQNPVVSQCETSIMMVMLIMMLMMMMMMMMMMTYPSDKFKRLSPVVPWALDQSAVVQKQGVVGSNLIWNLTFLIVMKLYTLWCPLVHSYISMHNFIFDTTFMKFGTHSLSALGEGLLVT